MFTYSSTGLRKTMVDPSGTTSYCYESRNRLMQKSTPQGILIYSYDQDGNITSIASQNPNGSARTGASVTYGWNALNQLSGVNDARLAAGAQTTQYTYDKNGNLDTYTYPNTIKAVHVFDELNRLKSITTSKGAQTPALASFAYTVGSAGNRTKVVEQSGRTVTYGYDYRYRLKTETIALDVTALNGTVSYAFDAAGNRLSRTPSGGATLMSRLDDPGIP